MDGQAGRTGNAAGVNLRQAGHLPSHQVALALQLAQEHPSLVLYEGSHPFHRSGFLARPRHTKSVK
jgi:hypothetical protein